MALTTPFRAYRFRTGERRMGLTPPLPPRKATILSVRRASWASGGVWPVAMRLMTPPRRTRPFAR
eukprot:4736862-Alexandrium_andersonii.AAC.1